MKLEIRKINLPSLALSAYPLVLFALAAVRAVILPYDMSPEATLMQSVLQVILQVLMETAAMLFISVVIAFIYNLFCSFGIKGIRFDIAEVEEVSAQGE